MAQSSMAGAVRPLRYEPLARFVRPLRAGPRPGAAPGFVRPLGVGLRERGAGQRCRAGDAIPPPGMGPEEPEPEDGAGDGPEGGQPKPEKGSWDKRSQPRRQGRPPSQRSPDDSPLRDGNRDRLEGLLTMRAAKTLLFYCTETNQHLYRWLGLYINENPIPDAGAWEDVSGETFIRGMLQGENARVIPEVKAALVDPLFDCSPVLGVDPRQVAQRILDIRKQLIDEFIEDMEGIKANNYSLIAESLTLSLGSIDEPASEGEEGGDGEGVD